MTTEEKNMNAATPVAQLAALLAPSQPETEPDDPHPQHPLLQNSQPQVTDNKAKGKGNGKNRQGATAAIPGGQLSLVTEPSKEESEPPAKVDATLTEILSWKRPFQSAGELHFMTWLHSEIKARIVRSGRPAVFEVAAEGNVVVTIKRPDNKISTVLFSCHTDTVHAECSGKQKLLYDPAFGHIFLDKQDPSSGSCLGADDGAGVWLMLNMIERKVPGTYVFHRGEERGGVGSNKLLAAKAEWLGEHEIAVAFDRKGHNDIVTHQGGIQCASDKFGNALAAKLNAHGFRYELSRGGTFTDTKVYRGVICECVNISVGYHDQHSRDESLDYTHLVELLDAVCKIDWDTLPVEREPKIEGYVSNYGSSTGFAAQGWQPQNRPVSTHQTPHQPDEAFARMRELDDADVELNKKDGAPVPRMRKLINRVYASMDSQPAILEQLENLGIDDLQCMVEEDAGVGADIIVELLTELNAAYSKIRTLRTLMNLAVAE